MKPNPSMQEVASTERKLWLWTLLGLVLGKALTAVGRRKERRSVRVIGRSLTGCSILSVATLAWLAKIARQDAKDLEMQNARDAASTSDIRAFPPRRTSHIG